MACDNIQTGVWKVCDRVRSEFIQPLRHSLESTKLQCRGEREWQSGGGCGGRYTVLLVML